MEEYKKLKVKKLAEKLFTSDAQERFDAVISLGEIGNEQVVEPLISALRDTDKDVRLEAARALGMIKDKRAVEPLRRSWETDESPAVQMMAAAGLVKIEGDEKSFNYLLKGLEECRSYAVSALTELGVSVIKPLIKELNADKERGQRGHWFWIGAADVLGWIKDKQAIEPLIEMFRNENELVRDNAAFNFRKFGELAVEPLIKVLADKNENVRCAAVKALGWTKSNRALDVLVKMLESDTLPVRRAIAIALGRIGDKQAVEPLIKALEDKNKDVRYNAAEALGRIGDERAVEPLIKALEDKDLYVCENAIEALGKIGDERAVEPLAELLKEEENLSLKGKKIIHALGNIVKKTKSTRVISILINPPTLSKEVRKAAQSKIELIAKSDRQVRTDLQRCRALQELADLGGLT